MPVTTEAIIAIIAVLVATIPIGISLFKYWKRRARQSWDIADLSRKPDRWRYDPWPKQQPSESYCAF
ncbi:hypothetical protein BJY00DRAFT_282519 [Aspergillus carlsbadensis]|nr:hypothetical protein BJY00DRAFT_282519 [Aspergillus carlsbadensis]